MNQGVGWHWSSSSLCPPSITSLAWQPASSCVRAGLPTLHIMCAHSLFISKHLINLVRRIVWGKSNAYDAVNLHPTSLAPFPTMWHPWHSWLTIESHEFHPYGTIPMLHILYILTVHRRSKVCVLDGCRCFVIILDRGGEVEWVWIDKMSNILMRKKKVVGRVWWQKKVIKKIPALSSLSAWTRLVGEGMVWWRTGDAATQGRVYPARSIVWEC